MPREVFQAISAISEMASWALMAAKAGCNQQPLSRICSNGRKSTHCQDFNCAPRRSLIIDDPVGSMSALIVVMPQNSSKVLSYICKGGGCCTHNPSHIGAMLFFLIGLNDPQMSLNGPTDDSKLSSLHKA